MLPLFNEQNLSRRLSFAICVVTLTTILGQHHGRLIISIMTEACEREARSLALEKAYVHQVYQQISDATDTMPDRGRAWPKVKQFLADLEPGSLVCDVGCGNGKYLNVNPSIFEIGVDRCKRLTEVAREKDHEVLMCDNLALPFRDESFDAVLSIAVVHHFATTDRRVQALRELARVLKIGGRLIISVWAMEQRHRKFESQDVLVPWHRPQQLSTPSLEFTSTTTTTTTSEEDGPPPYHAYTQTSDSESTRSQRGTYGVRKRGRNWHKGRSIDPSRPISSSQSSSSLSSPNETCYSFVRRALQKLAGGKRGTSPRRHRPWFLDSWTTCTKEPPSRRYDPDGCEDNDVEDIQDLPIELRRLEEDPDLPQRRQTFACSEKLSSSIEISLGHKSKSLSDILTVNQKCLVRSRSSASNLGASGTSESLQITTPTTVASTTNAAAATTTTTTTTIVATTTTTTTMVTTATPSAKVIAVGVITSQPKPKLVKQKQSLCEEEMEEAGGDLPTDMKDLVKRLPDFKIPVSGGVRRQGNVFKQSSMNEELMSTERLREKEMVRQNIQKQASLNEEILFRRQRTFDSIRDTFFSTSTARRFQILKDGLASKIKSSTTGIEKVAGASFKNGFVRILQGWKSEVPTYSTKPAPATPPPCEIRKASAFEEKTSNGNGQTLTSAGERRHSKEDGSDSSKDSSLQSDTSVDSEDSFASVIFIPKPEPTSETSPPMNTSPPSVPLTSPTFHSLPQSPQPTSPKLKGSLPPSPKFKYQSPTSPIIKQPSLPCKYQSPTSPNLKMQIPTSPIGLTKQHSLPTSPKFKYAVPPLSPSFSRSGDSPLNFQQKMSAFGCQQRTSPCPSITSSRQSSLEAEVGVGGETPKPSAPSSAREVPTVQVQEVTQTTEELPKIEEPKEVIATVATNENFKESRGGEAVAIVVKCETQVHPLDASRLRMGMHPRQCFPIVRRSFTAAGAGGRQENLAKPLPKLLSLELFNPETDDVDSDSSGVSSPDSISSVISVLTEELSAESHDAQQTKRSPSDGHSNSNSANDSDLNLSDQSLSSLPNSKSPEFLGSKSPENTSKSAEKSKGSDASSGSRTSEVPTPLDASKSLSKSLKSPETLSSSSDSLSKSSDLQKESEDSKSDEAVRTEHSSEFDEDDSKSSSSKHGSSRSPDFLSVRRAKLKPGKERSNHRERLVRKRDERFVAPACEMEEERCSPPSTATRRNLTSRSLSPSRSLIEAAADVASSLEGAVDAVIQSSPRARRRHLQLLESADSKWIVEDYSSGGASKSSPDREDNLSRIFKKCDVKGSLKIRHHDIGRKKSPEYMPSHDEPYPDFKFCKIKCHEDKPRRLSLDRYRSERSVSIENMPLLGSYEQETGHCSYDGDSGETTLARSESKRVSKERNRRESEMIVNMSRSIETGSSWSLGRSERFYQSLREAEREERRRNSSTWSLNRYNSICKADLARNALRRTRPDSEACEWGKKPEAGSFRMSEKPTVRIIREDSSLSADSSVGDNRRSTRSRSLSGRVLKDMEDRPQDSWGEEYRQNLANFADRLSEKLAEEIDQYREEANSKHIYSSLPSGLELMDDPYLTRLSAQLMDLNRLSAELKERNTYMASLSDEDVNKELCKPKQETNPFLSDSRVSSASNPFSAPGQQRNPFLTDDSGSERSKSDDSDGVTSKNVVTLEDSFVPLEIDSPPKAEDPEGAAVEQHPAGPADKEKRLVEGVEERPASEEKLAGTFGSSRNFSSLTPSSREKRKSLLFVKSASLDDSYKFLGKSSAVEKKNEKFRDDGGMAETRGKKQSEGKAKAVTSTSRTEEPKRIVSSLESSRSPGKTHSTESADQDSGSRKSTRIPSWESSMDTDPGSSIQRDLSKMTIASSLGYSMESSDPEASVGTGSGSDCSRRDASRVTASTTSLGHSIESSDPGDVSERTGSGSDFSKKETSSAETGRTAGSTASLGPESGSECSKDTGYADRRKFRCDGRSSSEEAPRRIQLIRQKSTVQEPPETPAKSESFDNSLNGSTSQESLPSDNGGGAITFHRFYHVFREGELDQLIEKYVDNLHIISSYYDHANWCVIAEKVQVWTI